MFTKLRGNVVPNGLLQVLMRDFIAFLNIIIIHKYHTLKCTREDLNKPKDSAVKLATHCYTIQNQYIPETGVTLTRQEYASQFVLPTTVYELPVLFLVMGSFLTTTCLGLKQKWCLR